MKTLIFLISILFFVSCAMKPGYGLPEEDKIYITKQYVGKFDTCRAMNHKWYITPTMVICLDNSTALIITGKKCKFKKGEMLYVKTDFWYVTNHWKWYLLNYDESLRYFLR